MAVTANFGNLSEYEKLQLSWAHGITSVTGLRLGIRTVTLQRVEGLEPIGMFLFVFYILC